MIRYAIYDITTNGYVGHRTSCYDYNKSLPVHMITKNYPCVDYTDARLFVRKYDADKLLNVFNKMFPDRFMIREFLCYPRELNKDNGPKHEGLFQ